MQGQIQQGRPLTTFLGEIEISGNNILNTTGKAFNDDADMKSIYA